MGIKAGILPKDARWVLPSALLLLVAIVGCSSASAAEPSASHTPARSASSVAQVDVVVSTPTATAVSPPSRTPPTDVLPTSTGTPPPTATRAPLPSPTNTGTATATTTPTATPSPSPTPTPALRQVTTGGCCTQPIWSPDSRWLVYIDKPSPDEPVGFWGVDTTQPGSTPQLLTERIAFYTSDLSHVIEYGPGETTIAQLASPLSETVTDRWSVPAGGRAISISPNRTRVAWAVSNDNAPSELRVSEVWVANFDGTEPQSVIKLPRGGFAGWITDDRLLLSGRESLESRETVVYAYSLIDGSMVELVRAERLRGFQPSPDRTWMVYYVSLSDEPGKNGLWLLRTDNGERRQLSRELFGSYAWRDARRLLIIPFRPDAQYHELWEVDVETGEARQLTDPAVTAFKVANADWQVSPDGRHVAFVESRDHNIWMLTLAD